MLLPLLWLTSCWPSAGWAASPDWLESRKGTSECQGNTGTDRGSTLVQTVGREEKQEEIRWSVTVFVMSSDERPKFCPLAAGSTEKDTFMESSWAVGPWMEHSAPLINTDTYTYQPSGWWGLWGHVMHGWGNLLFHQTFLRPDAYLH